MTTTDGGTVFMLHTEVSLQDLGEGEGGVILRVDTGELYTVNDTAAAFLGHIDGGTTVREAADRIADVFDAPIETILADMIELAAELEAQSVLVRAA